MADIRPFLCIHPARELASRVAALPYDVFSREEAREEAAKDPLSFLNIDRPETQFPPEQDMYAPEVYEKAASMLRDRIRDGIFVKDEEPCYYLYELTMNGRAQTGIVACAAVDDYLGGVIRRHENTREEKEQDRIRHVDTCGAQTGPIFLAYRDDARIDAVTSAVKTGEAWADFESGDGIRHRVWRIDDSRDAAVIREAFAGMDSLYIADGHHRAASAVKTALARRERLGAGHTGAERDYFLSVLFPDKDLLIMAYNRYVKDLCGMTPETFLAKVRERMKAEPSPVPVEPSAKGTFGMYLDHQWYTLTFPEERRSSDPVNSLDVSVLQNEVLAPVLGIGDPRTDERIAFIGGIRGLSELSKRADAGGVSFSLYPTSIGELFSVADAGRLMPPKSTWFEPKLRSGLFIHEID